MTHQRQTALSVNLNKVALVRNTRHLGIPDVVKAAKICLMADAHGITVHPRPDQRHIRTHDVFDLAEELQRWPDREYNIEGNPFHNLIEVATKVKQRGLPLHQLTFVPDSEGQFTSDHGWTFPQDAERLKPVIEAGKALGARISLFMDAEPGQMAAAKAVGADRVELYTEPYAASWGTPEHAVQLERFRAAARAALDVGLEVNAGHDLNRDNLPSFLSEVPGVSEVSIGHALIADALEMGYAQTIKAYLECCAASGQGMAT